MHWLTHWLELRIWFNRKALKVDTENSAISDIAQALNAVLLSFGESIASYRFASYLSCKTFNEAKEKLDSQINKYSVNLWAAASASDVRKSPRALIEIGAKGASNEQVLKTLSDNHNHQNLWIMVSAFEAYEKFLKDLYGALGYLDQSLWRCEDFGNIKISQLNDKDKTWFVDRVRQTIAINSTKKITARLRDNFPSFEARNSCTSFRVDLDTQL